MAIYQETNAVAHGTGPAFDDLFTPPTKAPRAGIYRCTKCTREIAINAGDPLPNFASHGHRKNVGPAQWRMIVFAMTQG